MITQKDYVEGCLAYYEEQGITPGDPNDGDWEECHYPEPKGVGEKVVYLLHENHQPQGLLQSEEYDRPCFYNGDVARFLTHGPFVPGWFELYDLYDKWSGYYGTASCKNRHSVKDETGSSLCNSLLHQEKTEEGKSVHAVHMGEKTHVVKDDLGRSVNGVKGAERLHSEKDEQGKSVAAVKGGSRGGLKGAKTTNSQKWRCLTTGHVSTPGPLARWQKARGHPPLRELVPLGELDPNSTTDPETTS